MVTPFCMKVKQSKYLMKFGKGHLKDSSQSSPRTRSKPRSALANKEVLTQGPWMLPVQHTSELSSQPYPRILDMIRGAATAGLLPEQPLSARLDAQFEAASAAFLDETENSTAQLYVQKAAPRTRQFQMSNRQVSSPSTMTTTPNPHLPHLGEDDSVYRSSKLNFPTVRQNQTAALQKHLVDQRSVATSDENRGFVPHACLAFVALPL